ncbi:MAG: hypothetical protein H6559_24940 [Lewinellaceae bacterium]|nr:hypothetical protein [Lewinellaceae bacterium]
MEKAESWFWAELIPFSSKVKARAKKGKGKKKKPAKANKKEVLTNFCSSEEECQIVAKCFRLLKRAFVKKKQYPKALEMLRLAGIFRALSPDEVAEGLQMAGHLQLGSGYWLGEAAVCYSQNGDETAKTILNHAARQGNELAEFILSLHSKAKQL